MRLLRTLGWVGVALWLSACSSDTERAGRAGTVAEDGFTEAEELVVDLEDGTELAAFLADYPDLDPEAVRWNSPNVADEAIAVVRVDASRQAALLEALRADARVESAEFNGSYGLSPPQHGARFLHDHTYPDGADDEEPATEGFPNDPLFAKQWNLAMVRALDAWAYSVGQDVIVAVIDTGVAYEEEKGLWAPDLRTTRFVEGYDFVNDDAVAADDNGHGTHCAGTIAQSTDNGRGVAGLAPGVRIMPLKVLNLLGFGSVSDIADAIRFAADHGAHVLSLSLGGGSYSKILADAVAYAHGRGCMVICAAGNAGRSTVEYPAAYPGATAVSSVGPSKQLAFYSSHGKQTFLAAPGGDKSSNPEHGVLQNTIDLASPTGTSYAFLQGTSMATPHVSAASALLIGAGVTRPDAIHELLAVTAQRPEGAAEAGWSARYGWGVLDAGAAVQRAVFVPAVVTLILSVVLGFLTVRWTQPKVVGRVLLAFGAVLGGCGLFALAPLGLGQVPVVGPFLIRGAATWDLPLFGPSIHWSPLFASALIPFVLGWVSIPFRATRSLALGIMLGWATRLATGALVPYTDVRWIPGAGVLDGVWLCGNALVLVLTMAAVARLGRTRQERVVA